MLSWEKIRKGKIVFLVGIALIVPLACVLDPSVAWENGPIENTQAAVLLGGTLWNLRAILGGKKWRALHRIFAGMFFFMFLREISYGRVFFPLGIGEDGPYFPKMRDFAYHVEIYIFLGVFLSALLWDALKNFPVRSFLKMRSAHFFIVYASVCACISVIGDHGWLFSQSEGQILEEFAELLMYLSMIFLSACY